MNTKKSQKSKVKSQKSGKNPSKLIFILGGARSGKSAYALTIAESINGKRAFLATGEALDDEMTERIKRHKKQRGDNWITIDEPLNIADVIRKNKKYDVILIDCLTLWLSNLMNTAARGKAGTHPQGWVGAKIKGEIKNLVSVCKKAKYNIIIVSNEVGLGIVPDNSISRQFRDIAGMANQKIAKASDVLYLVVSGIPIRIK